MAHVHSAGVAATSLLFYGVITLAIPQTQAARPPVTEGLILHLDAEAQVRAKGHRPDNDTWQNLAFTSDAMAGNGALRNFAFDGSSGWAGSGSPDDPYALRFDGERSYVLGTGDLQLPELTIEVWARVEGVGGRPTRRGATLIGNDFGGGGVSLLVQPRTGSPILLHDITFTPVDAETPGDEWLQVVAALNGDAAKLYVNGVWAADVPADRHPEAPHEPGYQLGAARHARNDYVEADGLIGLISIVRVYNRVLSATEIAA